MNRTPIEWTTFSANPLKYRDALGRVVWACVHASEGCRNCYSEALAKRYRRGGPFAAHVMKGLTPFLDENELRHMCNARVIGGLAVAGQRCFVEDMSDLFGEWVPDDLLNRLFTQVFEQRQDVTWQLLTKRADRALRYLSWRLGEGRIPARNIHVGVSVEDQKTADERIPLLLQTPAAVRFISQEPQLEAITYPSQWLSLVDWLIQGGESGPGARPFQMSWADLTREQCKTHAVWYFLKQVGAVPLVEPGRQQHWDWGQGIGRPDPRFTAVDPNHPASSLWRVHLTDRKGGDLAELPPRYRVRGFPEVRA